MKTQTQTAHTPIDNMAPWLVMDDTEVVDRNGFFVATTHDPASDIGTAKEYANARLIAAAPELLSALRRLMDCPDLCLDTLEPESDAAIDSARAAIAKAEEGRS